MKNVGKLLAVTLAVASPAAAGPTHATHAKPAPAKTSPAPRTIRVAPKPIVKPIAKPAPQAPAAAPMQPRQLPSGAPACGNVQTKAPRRNCEVVMTASNASERR